MTGGTSCSARLSRAWISSAKSRATRPITFYISPRSTSSLPPAVLYDGLPPPPLPRLLLSLSPSSHYCRRRHDCRRSALGGRVRWKHVGHLRPGAERTPGPGSPTDLPICHPRHATPCPVARSGPIHTQHAHRQHPCPAASCRRVRLPCAHNPRAGALPSLCSPGRAPLQNGWPSAAEGGRGRRSRSTYK